MKRQIVKIKQNIYWVLWFLTTVVLVSFTTRKQDKKECQKIHVHIDNQYENFFLESTDVVSLLTSGNKKIIVGLTKQAIDLNKYENLLTKNTFVLKTSVSTTHTGDLMVYVSENRPVARIFEENKSYYIDKTGLKLPLSKNYTSRSTVVFNNLKNQELKSKEASEYLALINYISQHDFWKKQIAEIEINKKGKVFLYPQVGHQKISFGGPENIEEKFFKLGVFFKKILPSVGWNKYNLVKLEFNGQLVCE